jgi:chorismate mutase
MTVNDTAWTQQQLAALRAQIDVVDDRLRELLGDRRDLSQRIQALRAELGNAGVQPSREAEVAAGYVSALGGHGHEVAEAVLLLCRGAVPSRPAGPGTRSGR